MFFEIAFYIVSSVCLQVHGRFSKSLYLFVCVLLQVGGRFSKLLCLLFLVCFDRLVDVFRNCFSYCF